MLVEQRGFFEGCDCEIVGCLLDLGLSKGAIGEVAGQSADENQPDIDLAEGRMLWLARSRTCC